MGWLGLKWFLRHKRAHFVLSKEKLSWPGPLFWFPSLINHTATFAVNESLVLSDKAFELHESPTCFFEFGYDGFKILAFKNVCFFH